MPTLPTQPGWAVSQEQNLLVILPQLIQFNSGGYSVVLFPIVDRQLASPTSPFYYPGSLDGAFLGHEQQFPGLGM